VAQATQKLSIADQKMFYRPICTESEIQRIFAPKTAMDYLLKMRADYIVDHMRIFRFYRRIWLKDERNYSLEKTFDTKHYRNYRMSLSKADRESLSEVTYGNIFTQEANGQIFNSPFGRIVTISQALNYFLQFSHLALLGFKDEVPPHIRFRALLIALRVMFEHESFDFDADPRGKIPPSILKEIRRPIPVQLEFIAGHEFAHHLLGHLSDERLHDAPESGEEGEKRSVNQLPMYSTSEQEELSADLTAIMRPMMDHTTRATMLNAALIWLGALEIFQYAQDVISPRPPGKAKSHPSARTRHLNLLENVETKFSVAMGEVSDRLITSIESFKKPVSDFLGFHVEQFETYGSFYLDEPNTDWRGRPLIDRVDYY